jgi:hypothetical protein
MMYIGTSLRLVGNASGSEKESHLLFAVRCLLAAVFQLVVTP